MFFCYKIMFAHNTPHIFVAPIEHYTRLQLFVKQNLYFIFFTRFLHFDYSFIFLLY